MTRDYDRARTIEDGMDDDRAVLYALETFMHGVAGTEDDPDVGPVEAAYRALDKIDSLQERAAELEELVDPDPGSVSYQQLTFAQKVRRIRRHLVTVASNTDGKCSMFYDDVQKHFGGHPSPGHCYDLMKRAADLDGFNYDQAGGGQGQKRIRVNIGDVNDESLIHAANNASEEEAA